jgi:alkylation response protein AidB-like acyl-CoA dehydrogenase
MPMSAEEQAEQAIALDLSGRVQALLDEHDPASSDPREFLAARFDAGLAWVHFPRGSGGLDLPRSFQSQVETDLTAAGAPLGGGEHNGIGMGMAAPTIAAFGSPEQQRKFLRPLFTGEHIYCQLFSEPGAGSDLAGVSTRAVRDGDDWIVNGQKVWTSGAQNAQMAILVARTDPTVPKHQGLTYFVCDMTDGGVEVRPLRQITGEAEFNEVFLTDVRVPDANRLGPEGGGWKVATTTLNNERVAIGSMAGGVRETGMIGKVAQAWRAEPRLRNPAMHDELMRLWVEAEVARLTGLGLRQRLTAGQPGPEGAGMKVTFARLAQAISGFEIELHPESGLRYDDWTMRQPEKVDFTGREPGYRYLRARGNSIEGGTSEILRNTIAERILGLPPEHRVDKDVAFKDLDKGAAR